MRQALILPQHASNPFFLTLLTVIFVSGGPMVASGAYSGSAHGNSTSGVSGRASGYATGNCGHCHDQHASRDSATHTAYNVLRGLEEENLCFDCHDGTPADDINAQFLKTYRHPVPDAAYDNLHTVSKLEMDTASQGSAFRSPYRHAECSDCHNPHEAKKGNHVAYSGGTVSSISKSNAISNALTGVWGVELSSEPVSFSPATNFTEMTAATKEYQICFKCHTYYALNDADGITSFNGPSGQTITDQGMEFSKNNRSVHPVRFGLTAQTGSNALDATQTDDRWTSVGTQTMYCGDCHGADNELSGGAIGPHGSTAKYMLKGLRKTTAVWWPANSNGKLWSLNDIAQSEGRSGSAPTINSTADVQAKLFCLNCHNSFGGTLANPFNTSTNSTNWVNRAHQEHDNRNYRPFGADNHNVYCVACHSAVPHGNQRSSLIVYDGRNAKYGSDSAPYVYKVGANNYGAISGFKKTTHTTYGKSYCWSTVSGCSGDHSDNPPGGSYETNP